MSYKVKLEIFEGPLDLLLYLVKQNHLEIGTISVARITDQYLQTLELMQALDLEVAGEFLVIAATLMQIKSRSLLPPEAVPLEEQEEPDPALTLIQRLLEYQKFKEAAQQLSAMEQHRLVQFTRSGPASESAESAPAEELVEASLFDLLTAFSQFMSGQIPKELFHEIIQDEVTVEEKVALLRSRIQECQRLKLTDLFPEQGSKIEIVATFLGLLELIRLKEVVIRQQELFGEIWILRSAGVETPT